MYSNVVMKHTLHFHPVVQRGYLPLLSLGWQSIHHAFGGKKFVKRTLAVVTTTTSS